MIELVYPVGAPAPVLQRRSELAGVAASEMLPIVDASGIVIGQASRAWCHGGEKPLHPVVHLHVLNRNCELYIQKRSMKKDLLPGYWDTAVGGHVSYGESVLEALFREAGVELVHKSDEILAYEGQKAGKAPAKTAKKVPKKAK